MFRPTGFNDFMMMSQPIKGLFSKDFIGIFNNFVISVYPMLFENFSFILYT